MLDICWSCQTWLTQLPAWTAAVPLCIRARWNGTFPSLTQRRFRYLRYRYHLSANQNRVCSTIGHKLQADVHSWHSKLSFGLNYRVIRNSTSFRLSEYRHIRITLKRRDVLLYPFRHRALIRSTRLVLPFSVNASDPAKPKTTMVRKWWNREKLSWITDLVVVYCDVYHRCLPLRLGRGFSKLAYIFDYRFARYY